MAGFNTGGFELNIPMMFSSGTEVAHTKTPANVPASYTQQPPEPFIEDEEDISIPVASSLPSASKKRKASDGTGAEAPKQKRQKQKRKTGRKNTAARIIPHSFDECTPEDKELIRMREAGGSDWKAIRDEWEKMTGEKTAVSTLPNRYARLKCNFTVIKEEDNGRLLLAKREVEDSFESQKWDLISRVVRQKGGDEYGGVVLKRQYKKLMVRGGVQPPAGVRDADFEDVDDEDEE